MMPEHSNYKPGDIIDLTPFSRKRELKPELLFEELAKISRDTNKRVSEKLGLSNLLDLDGSISKSGFSKENGGPYNKSKIDNDIKEERIIEIKFARANNEIDPLKQEQLLQKWKKEKRNFKSTKVELLMTIFLNKQLGEDYVIMRSALIDDYGAGIDYIAVNIKTGETICTFDGVAENDSNANEFSKTNSDKKITKIAQAGGANVKYGIQLVDGKLIRTQISNVPVFYLSLLDKDFEILSESIGKEPNAEILKDESRIFTQFINSLEKQQKDLLQLNLPKDSPVYKNILNFENTLKNLREISNRKNTEDTSNIKYKEAA